MNIASRTQLQFTVKALRIIIIFIIIIIIIRIIIIIIVIIVQCSLCVDVYYG